MGKDMKPFYLYRTIRNRCPRCGEGAVLENLFNRHDKCSSCGFQYSREDGFFIGGIPISYALICFFWIVPLLMVWIFGWIGLEWLLGLCFAGESFCLSSVILILNAFGWGSTSFLPTTRCRIFRERAGFRNR